MGVRTVAAALAACLVARDVDAGQPRCATERTDCIYRRTSVAFGNSLHDLFRRLGPGSRELCSAEHWAARDTCSQDCPLKLVVTAPESVQMTACVVDSMFSPYLTESHLHDAHELNGKEYSLVTLPPAVRTGCLQSDFDGVDVAGKLVVIMRGHCWFFRKLANAFNRGARASIVVNSHPSSSVMHQELQMTGPGSTLFPGMFAGLLPRMYGELLLAALDQGQEVKAKYQVDCPSLALSNGTAVNRSVEVASGHCPHPAMIGICQEETAPQRRLCTQCPLEVRLAGTAENLFCLWGNDMQPRADAASTLIPSVLGLPALGLKWAYLVVDGSGCSPGTLRGLAGYTVVVRLPTACLPLTVALALQRAGATGYIGLPLGDQRTPTVEGPANSIAHTGFVVHVLSVQDTGPFMALFEGAGCEGEACLVSAPRRLASYTAGDAFVFDVDVVKGTRDDFPAPPKKDQDKGPMLDIRGIESVPKLEWTVLFTLGFTTSVVLALAIVLKLAKDREDAEHPMTLKERMRSVFACISGSVGAVCARLCGPAKPAAAPWTAACPEKKDDVLDDASLLSSQKDAAKDRGIDFPLSVVNTSLSVTLLVVMAVTIVALTINAGVNAVDKAVDNGEHATRLINQTATHNIETLSRELRKSVLDRVSVSLRQLILRGDAIADSTAAAYSTATGEWDDFNMRYNALVDIGRRSEDWVASVLTTRGMLEGEIECQFPRTQHAAGFFASITHKTDDRPDDVRADGLAHVSVTKDGSLYGHLSHLYRSDVRKNVPFLVDIPANTSYLHRLGTSFGDPFGVVALKPPEYKVYYFSPELFRLYVGDPTGTNDQLAESHTLSVFTPIHDYDQTLLGHAESSISLNAIGHMISCVLTDSDVLLANLRIVIFDLQSRYVISSNEGRISYPSFERVNGVPVSNERLVKLHEAVPIELVALNHYFNRGTGRAFSDGNTTSVSGLMHQDEHYREPWHKYVVWDLRFATSSAGSVVTDRGSNTYLAEPGGNFTYVHTFPGDHGVRMVASVGALALALNGTGYLHVYRNLTITDRIVRETATDLRPQSWNSTHPAFANIMKIPNTDDQYCPTYYASAAGEPLPLQCHLKPSFLLGDVTLAVEFVPTSDVDPLDVDQVLFTDKAVGLARAKLFASGRFVMGVTRYFCETPPLGKGVVRGGVAHTLVATIDEVGKTCAVYHNGKLHATSNLAIRSWDELTAAPYLVGHRYHGLITAIQVFRRVLDAADVARLHATGEYSRVVPPLPWLLQGETFILNDSRHEGVQWGVVTLLPEQDVLHDVNVTTNRAVRNFHQANENNRRRLRQTFSDSTVVIVALVLLSVLIFLVFNSLLVRPFEHFAVVMQRASVLALDEVPEAHSYIAEVNVLTESLASLVLTLRGYKAFLPQVVVPHGPSEGDACGITLSRHGVAPHISDKDDAPAPYRGHPPGTSRLRRMAMVRAKPSQSNLPVTVTSTNVRGEVTTMATLLASAPSPDGGNGGSGASPSGAAGVGSSKASPSIESAASGNGTKSEASSGQTPETKESPPPPQGRRLSLMIPQNVWDTAAEGSPVALTPRSARFVEQQRRQSSPTMSEMRSRCSVGSAGYRGSIDVSPVAADASPHVSRAESDGAERVAIVFTDIKGSTQLWEHCTEGMKACMRVHNEAIRSCIRRHDGYEVKTIGDAFMVAFESPVDAVLFASDVLRTLHDAPWPQSILSYYGNTTPANDAFHGLLLRIGINYGPAEVEENPLTERFDYFGPTVNKAARVESSAPPGSIAVTEDVLACIKPLITERSHSQESTCSLTDDGYPKLACVDMHSVVLNGIKGASRLTALVPVDMHTRLPSIRELVAQRHKLSMRKGSESGGNPLAPGCRPHPELRGFDAVSVDSDLKVPSPNAVSLASSDRSLRNKIEESAQSAHGAFLGSTRVYMQAGANGVATSAATTSTTAKIAVQPLYASHGSARNNEVGDHWAMVGDLFARIAAALDRTEGSVLGVSGFSVQVGWGVLKRSAAHAEGAVRFCGFLKGSLAEEGLASHAHVALGLVTGKVSSGYLVGARTSRYVSFAGLPTQLAETLVGLALALRTLGLYATVLEPQPSKLVKFMRPVLGMSPSARSADRIVAYELNERLLQNVRGDKYAFLHHAPNAVACSDDEKLPWGWTQAYHSCFHKRSVATLEAYLGIHADSVLRWALSKLQAELSEDPLPPSLAAAETTACLLGPGESR